ncbi:SbcC/MukB-like Walker B domain-containing protein [Sphingobacterium spiritivorum]|uniref:SbcC/MukB-like Walker B domain-containing protein n=1 Tax=Sphingobacterium spiritivorum TaxID=258 RepID=UPI003DA6B3EF
MLPIYLSIEGLYSYQEKQEIDFTKLTEAGLFGIFGNVGSGKSSILEAISFALYGNTERLNSKENRSYNMLNLKSAAATIIFDFINFENRRFRFAVHWKRKKKFDQTSTIERVAYEWLQHNWVPMESADATHITNLTYQNFKRTIIIPQGQFKEFLDLKGKDRSDMMKEIFNLDKYDLGPKVSVLQIENNRKIEHLQGALSGFEEINSGTIELKKNALGEAKVLLDQLRSAYQQTENSYKVLSEAKANRENLKEKEEQFAQLKLKQPEILHLEKELDEYEKLVSLFREPLDRIDSLQRDQDQLELKIQNLLQEKQQTSLTLKEKELSFQKVEKDFRKIEELKIKISDLKNLIQIRTQQSEKSNLQSRLAKGTPILEQTRKEEQVFIADINLQETTLEQLKSVRIDTSELMEIDNWYQRHDLLLKNKSALIEKVDLLKLQQEELISSFTVNGYTVDNWESEITNQLQQITVDIRALTKQETDLQVQKELGRFADNLHHEEACPLCGSLDHPHPMQIHDVSIQLEELKAKQTEITERQQQLQSLLSQMTRWSTSYQDKKAQLEAAAKELQQADEQLTELRTRFSWENFRWDDRTLFDEQKTALRQSEIQIKEAELLLKSLRVQLAETQSKAAKFERSLNEFTQQIAVIDGLITQHKMQIQAIQIEDYNHNNDQDLLAEIQNAEELIIRTEEQHKTLQAAINQLHTIVASIQGKHTEALENYQNTVQKIDKLNQEILAHIEQQHLPGIRAIQLVLQKNLPVIENRKRIHDYKVAYETLQKQITELMQSNAVQDFDEALFERTKIELEEKKSAHELHIAHTGALERELQRLEQEFEKKRKLLTEFEKLSHRKDNLRTLDNMFKGSGFVNYVSSIHLQRLCDIANQRFHRLTKNQLSLIINEANEFEVIDYLNNGYRRSVKTLSGGQGFQASLCLALALAENIQSLNKADKNFFFIDEGFGTQDAESMNTVFETLQYLNKENRIVGIISHVEELKERIPMSVTVTKDLERGSIVKMSS